MSGGAGHIYDMIGRLKNNASLLKKPGYFKVKEELRRVTGKSVYRYKKATPEQLTEIRKKLIKQRKKRLLKATGYMFFSILLAFAIVNLIIYWFI